MTAISVTAALQLALVCAPSVDPAMIKAIAQRESGLDPLTIHDNATGKVLHGDGVVQAAAQLISAGHSVDLGLMQINSRNLNLLGLPLRDAFTACKSVEAAAKLLSLFSRYNTGSPSKGIANGYAASVMATMDEGRADTAGTTVTEIKSNEPPQPDPCADIPRFDAWALADCHQQHQGDNQ